MFTVSKHRDGALVETKVFNCADLHRLAAQKSPMCSGLSQNLEQIRHLLQHVFFAHQKFENSRTGKLCSGNVSGLYLLSQQTECTNTVIDRAMMCVLWLRSQQTMFTT